MLEKLKEFKETLSERIRSPFVGSFVITWSIIHWKLFALFLFEQKDIKVHERIYCIEEYILSKGIFKLFIMPILITLGLLIIYSILNAIGLVIKLGYDNWASPLIQSLLYNKNIVERPKYDKIKKQFSELKKEYDEDKDKFMIAIKNAKDVDLALEEYKKNSIVMNSTTDISLILGKDIQWENYHIYPDGKDDSEIFSCDKDGFILPFGKKIEIKNIKYSGDGKILAFDKIIGNKIITNYLIKDSNFNYYGIEGDNIQIAYRKKINQIITINSAKYICENNFIDVKHIIQRQLDANILEFVVTNELMGGDPGWRKLKSLEIDYTKNNQTKKIIIAENGTVKF